MVDKTIGGNWFDDVNSTHSTRDVTEKLRTGFPECAKQFWETIVYEAQKDLTVKNPPCLLGFSCCLCFLLRLQVDIFYLQV